MLGSRAQDLRRIYSFAWIWLIVSTGAVPGYVPGIVYHDFHGPKSKRFYNTRDLILEENNYNPDTDIKYDAQGSLQLETWEPRQKKMRDQIRGYFRSRNEDSIDND